MTYTLSDGTCSNLGAVGEYSFRETASAVPYVIIGVFDSESDMPMQEMLGNCKINDIAIQDCHQCYFSNAIKLKKCTICSSGMYARRNKGICSPCNIENCRKCE